MQTIEEKIKKKKKQDLILIGIGYVVALIFSMQFFRAYLQIGNLKDINAVTELMTQNLTSSFMFIPTLEYKKVFFVVTMGFGIYALLKATEDTKKFMKGVEHGSSRWATDKEKHQFQDKNFNNNIILSDDVFLNVNAKKIRRNLNVAIVGGSGTGKTRFYVKPNMMQLNTSYIVLDPKGELLIETGKMMQDNGYKVKILNIKDMLQSMHYNPFAYVRKDQDVFKLIKTIIKNTNEGAKGGDPFWQHAETALLQACFFYLYQERPKSEQTLPNVMKLLRMAKVSEQDEDAQSPLDILFEELEESKGETISCKQYHVFKAGAGKTAKSILISALSRLAFLDLPEVEELFGHEDEMHFENIGEEKTVLYMIIPDTDASFNFIAAMAYTQMFDILCQTADAKPLKYPVRFLMDEFANCGQIPDFEKVLATIRSRNISANIILQSVSQIENLYKDCWKSIIDNCDSTLYLGGQETSEWISKRLGKTTIDSKVTNKNKGRNGSSSDNFSILGRELMTPGEVSQMPNTDCIVMVRGCSPMYSKKFNIERHKKYKELGDVGEYGHPNNFSFADVKRDENEEEFNITNTAPEDMELDNRLANEEVNKVTEEESTSLEDELEALFENQNIEIIGDVQNENEEN